MSVATTTRKDIRQKVARKLYAHRFPTASTTTSAASVANQLNDTTLAGSGQTEDFIGAWIYIAETETGSPPVAEVRRVIDTNFDSSTSQLVVLPAFTDTINSGMDYEIHYKFHPTVIHDTINDILENLKGSIYLPITVVADGDMEDSGTSEWTASGLTMAKSTSQVLHGRQSLKLDCSAVNQTVRSANIYNLSDRTVLVSADVWIGHVSGDITMRLVDQDAAVINDDDIARSTHYGWQTLQFVTRIPEDNEYFRVRFMNNFSGSVEYDIDHLTVIPVDGNFVVPADAMERRSDFHGVFSIPTGQPLTESANDENTYAIFHEAPVEVPGISVLESGLALTPWRLVIPDTMQIQQPLFARYKTDYAALSDDTTTTLAPEAIVADLVLANLYEYMAEEAEENDEFQKVARLTAKAIQIRQKLRPLMEDFYPSHAKVTGANA